MAIIILTERRFYHHGNTRNNTRYTHSGFGTAQYWKVFPDLLITDGVKLMTEMCNTYWLLQDAFIWLHSDCTKGEEFIVFKLILDGHSALLSIDNGNYNVLAKQDIPFTDFPLQEGITMYWCDNVLMLPTEY